MFNIVISVIALIFSIITFIKVTIEGKRVSKELELEIKKNMDIYN